MKWRSLSFFFEDLKMSGWIFGSSHPGDVFRTQSNSKGRVFLRELIYELTITAKKRHIRCLTGFWICPRKSPHRKWNTQANATLLKIGHFLYSEKKFPLYSRKEHLHWIKFCTKNVKTVACIFLRILCKTCEQFLLKFFWWFQGK